MVNVVRESVADVDCVMMLVEPVASIGPQEEALIARLRETASPAILVINKIDTLEKPKLLEVIALYAAAYDFDAIIPMPGRNRSISPASVRRPSGKMSTENPSPSTSPM